MRIFITALTLCLYSVSAFAALPADQNPDLYSGKHNQVQSDHFAGQPYHVAGASQDKKQEPEPGSLVIPGESQGKEKKKCLNVCKKWGEDCIINPRTGARDCRRTCKQFGEECF